MPLTPQEQERLAYIENRPEYAVWARLVDVDADEATFEDLLRENAELRNRLEDFEDRITGGD